MKQYEYVSVHIGKLFGAASEEHREIINDYAAKGWRYVGFIPTNMNDYGKLKDIDLKKTKKHKKIPFCFHTGGVFSFIFRFFPAGHWAGFPALSQNPHLPADRLPLQPLPRKHNLPL